MKFFSLLKATVDDWLEDGALRLSAALAYYSIFSIAPLLIIAISVAGLVLGEEAVRGQIQTQLRGYLGSQAAASVESMIKSASAPAESWTGAIVGFCTMLLGASGVFGQLKDALNTIWEVKPKPGTGVFGMIHERLLNFGMVLVIGFLLLTSLLLSTALAALGGWIENVVGGPAFIGIVLGSIASYAVVAVLFAFIFKVLPDAEVQWRNVWLGAAATALLFEIGKWALSWYLGRESTTSSFGAAGSVVVLLLWVYYASCILLFGAEFTQVYARATGHDIQPSPGAEPVTAESRAQQGLVSGHEDPRPPMPTTTTPQLESPPGGSWRGLAWATAAGAAVGFFLGRRSKGSCPEINEPDHWSV